MSFRLSEDAARDYREIYRYSVEMFGLARADEYLDALEGALDLLTNYPRLGRDFSHVKLGTRRHEFQSHSIYYSAGAQGDILIMRILGSAQDPGRHL